MNAPGRASKLDPYGEEILGLHRQGRKLAEISKHLAHEYGLSVALSTLSEYVNRPRTGSAPAPAAAPSGTPAQEMLLDQVEVYAEIQASVRVIVDELQAMRNAFPDFASLEAQIAGLGRRLEARRAEMPAAINSELPAELTAILPRLEAFLAHQPSSPNSSASLPPAALIRRIWFRALWVTGAGWLLVIAGLAYWTGW